MFAYLSVCAVFFTAGYIIDQHQQVKALKKALHKQAEPQEEITRNFRGITL